MVFSPALGQLSHSLDTPTHALDELSLPLLASRVPAPAPRPRLIATTVVGNGDVREEVAQQGVLEDEARARDAEDVAEGAPELQRARDDGLLAVGRGREHGDEGAGELEALPQGGGHEAGEVGPGRPAAAHAGQQGRADEEQDGAAHERPLEPAEPRDQEPRRRAAHGRRYRRDHEVEARFRRRALEDGADEEGAEVISARASFLYPLFLSFCLSLSLSLLFIH